jgi:hypothetical protein
MSQLTWALFGPPNTSSQTIEQKSHHHQFVFALDEWHLNRTHSYVIMFPTTGLIREVVKTLPDEIISSQVERTPFSVDLQYWRLTGSSARQKKQVTAGL